MKTYIGVASILGFFLLFVNSVFGANGDSLRQAVQNIDSDRMLADITELSHSRYQGRQAGTAGGQRSGEFVAGRMKRLGLLPAGPVSVGDTIPSWFQRELIRVPQVFKPAHVEFSVLQQNNGILNIVPELGKDFLPVLDSPGVNMTAPVIFVGYGIEDPARGMSDYEGTDVSNRIVMVLRGKPPYYPKYLTHADKEKTAREKGAIGFITLTGPILNRYDARRGLGLAPLAMYSGEPEERPLPGVWINGEVGEQLFEFQKLSLRDVQTQLNEDPDYQLPDFALLARLQWETTFPSGSMTNVLGYLPGNDPLFKDEILIIGAHRDHFGQQAGLLFAGADDNASGTALLLEVARLLAGSNDGLQRSVLFLSFSGEERGLLGSKLYVGAPTWPLKKTVAMINIDHVGVGNEDLTVGVTNMPKTVAKEAAESAGLIERVKVYGYFPGGDHVPFAKVKIPTFAVVSSGTHPSFHQASDTVEAIQPEVLERATQYVLTLAWLLANPS